MTSSRLLVNAQNRTFKADTVTIGDRMLTLKADELANLCPEKTTTLDQYICVNNRVQGGKRRQTAGTGPDHQPRLCVGRGLPAPAASADKANFGDSALTMLNGQKIDEQTHTGLDLASRGPCRYPGRAGGRVVFVDYLGIYGNMVLVDHGLGLMTLYAHMSETQVNPGRRGQCGPDSGQNRAPPAWRWGITCISACW